jgi:hypothetical protein
MAKKCFFLGVFSLALLGGISAFLLWGYSYSTAVRCTLNLSYPYPGPDYLGAPDLAKFAIAADGSVYAISGTGGLGTEFVTRYSPGEPNSYEAVCAWPIFNKEGHSSTEIGCRGIAADKDGDVYVLLAASAAVTEVRKYDSTGVPLGQWHLCDSSGNDYAGRDLVVSADEALYVSGNEEIFKYDADGFLVASASGLPGASDLAIDAGGDIYILCSKPCPLREDHLIHRLDPELNYVEGWGHRGEYPFLDGWGGLGVDPGGNIVIGFSFAAGAPENAFLFDPHGSPITGIRFPTEAAQAAFVGHSTRIYRLNPGQPFDLSYVELSNALPKATDQNAVSPEGVQTEIELAAADEDNDPLTYSVLDPPRHGSISGTGRHLTYKPDEHYAGTDSFTFKAQDYDAYHSSNGATVAIRVTEEAEPGTLVVAPEYELNSAGERGGPFTPSSVIYTVQNSGGTTLSWTVSKAAAWVTLSSGGGTLDPGASALVSVEINSNAKALAAGIYSDTVFFTNTTTGSGNTTRAVTLTVNSTGFMSVTPAMGLTSSGLLGGPFSPVSLIYTIQNTGGGPITWTVSKAQNWITLSSGGGSLAPGASALVSVEINSNADVLGLGTYTDTVTFVNTENALGNATRAVALTVYATGVLEVTPAFELNSSGAVGGPFSPVSVIYTVKNAGGSRLSWTVAKTQAWVTLSSGGGTLDPGASALVSVEIDSDANSLAAGNYADTVTFTNTTNASGSTTRGVSLTVGSTPPTLAVTPAVGLTSSGTVGGPFTPADIVYTVQNTGGTALGWTAAKGQTWTTLSAASGTLLPNATTTVTVSINSAAYTLAAGTYTDTITFTNTMNGLGNTTRAVTLTVSNTPGILAVTPAAGLVSTGTAGGPFTPAGMTYTLQNTGGTALAWTAAKTQIWTTLSATAGTLAPGAATTVTVSINAAANALAAGAYNDTVSFTNTTNGRGNTTRLVGLTVNRPNTPPVANAGPDQNAPAGPGCTAPVVLDGSGSSDAEGDPLAYRWTWSGGSATGVSPTIQLPLGTTAITLVVNDGQVDSIPDTVAITVEDLTPPALQLSDPVCAVGPSGQKANKLTISATDECSAPAVPTVTKVEIYNTKGILLRGREVYAVSGNDIFVYSNNVFLVQVTATAVDQRGNSATQNWQKNLIKCK